MQDFLFTGWGAFWMVLYMLVPFALVFYYVIHRKSVVGAGPGAAARHDLSRVEGLWLGLVFIVFIGVNLASMKYMPTIATARAMASGQPLQQVDLSAKSWSYEISKREIVAGQPVRFSGRSTDTMHGFGVYHPDGRLLFTMMLMPGLKEPTSLVHTFRDPGKYKVRCLEYCGVAHHAMKDELVVVASNS